MSRSTIKLIAEFGPLIIFFTIYFNSDKNLYSAIPPFIIATIVSLIVVYFLEKKISMIALTSGVLISFFGGLTMYFDNKIFFYIKPTIVNLLFAAFLFFGKYFTKKPILKVFFKNSLNLKDEGWNKLSYRWILFFIFVALPQLASVGPDWIQKLLVLSPTLTAILAIGFFHAAYISELFRAGFLSVQPGQWEAASAIGMSTSQTKRRIIWPQAMKFALRPTTNHFVMMLKDTALVGFLGVPILFQRAERIGSQNLNLFETLLISAVIYWALTAVSLKVIDIIDRRVFSQ